MTTPALYGRILTPNGWIDGRLDIAPNGRIAAIAPCELPDHKRSGSTSSEASQLILPGFIDLHVHGGGGADCMGGAGALRTMAALHAKHGTTSLLATTMTAPREDLAITLQDLATVCDPSAARHPSNARVLGVHLEGPYISRERLGAQPDATLLPVLDEIIYYLSLAPIRVITLAPEIQHEAGLIAALAARGVRVQLGHTNASYEEASAALAQGASGFTHLYNAMSPLHHRAPGAVGAAFAHAQFSELIPDLLHVHPGAMRAALRAIPCLYCVTDGTAACGMPDGEYKLGSQDVNKCLGAVRMADGTLAGSTLTMDVALKNLVSLGLSIEDASRRLSQFPADYLGIADRGRLAVGAFADINVLSDTLYLQQTYIEGVSVSSEGSTNQN